MVGGTAHALVLAHPLTQRGELPASPLVMGLGAVYILFTVTALAARSRRGGATPVAATAEEPIDDDAVPGGGAGVAFWVLRGLGLVVFLLAIVAGRVGDPSELRNITPALVIGAGWPLLTLAALLVGGVWWWFNPFDTLARALSPLGAGEGSAAGPEHERAPVWWAVAPAAAWMIYLTVWPNALAPRSIAVAMILYTVATLAGCLALGRRTWLSRAEFFTVFFGLLAAARRRPAQWHPPAGAAVLLAVVSAGAVFGLLRDSDLSGFLGTTSRDLYSRITIVVLMAVAGVVAELAARRAAPGSVAVALIPAAAALVVALSVARNRLTTSLQLLPIAASNPFGGDLNIFGTRFNPLSPSPLGDVGPVWIQVGLLLAGSIAGVHLGRGFVATGVQRGGEFRRKRSSGIILGVLGTLLGIGVAAAAAI